MYTVLNGSCNDQLTLFETLLQVSGVVISHVLLLSPGDGVVVLHHSHRFSEDV